ncbi:MAG: DUF928 domain-containing protein [Verrucomicrobiota bacterium]
MKITRLVSGLILTTATAFAQMAHGPIYKEPFPNAPKMRVDGRVRGSDDALLTLTVLAPERVGQTTKAQPSLFWYQSKSNPTRFELTITEGQKPAPVLEVQFNRIPNDGVQRLRLADHNVTLTPGVEYRWSVAMIVDEENRSKDIVASGVIKRVEAPATLQKRVAGASDDDLAFIYADEGIWYDSLEALSNSIDKLPTKKELHEQRAVYFMQVGLNEAARHELKAAGKTATAPAK